MQNILLCEILRINRFFVWKILRCSISLQERHVSANNHHAIIRSHIYARGTMMKECDYITLFTRNEISCVLQSIDLQVSFPNIYSSVNVHWSFISCLYCSLTSLFPYTCHQYYYREYPTFKHRQHHSDHVLLKIEKFLQQVYLT